MQYIQAHKIYIATYLTDAETRSHGGGSCPGARLRGSHVRKRTTIVTGPRVFRDPSVLSGAAVGTASCKPGRPRLHWLRQTYPMRDARHPVAAAAKRGGCAANGRRHSHFEAGPCHRVAWHRGVATDPQGVLLEGNCRFATADEFKVLDAFSLHTCLRRLIGRSIDVRKVEHEQVDASTGGTSICPMGPPSVSHRPCSSGESLS